MDASLGPLDSDVVYTHDGSSVCAGRLAASSNTNEPPTSTTFSTSHGGWRGRRDLDNGRSGGRRGLVIGNAWLLLMCGVDSGNRGVMNHMSVMGSCSTSDEE